MKRRLNVSRYVKWALWKEYERDTIFCQKWSLKGWGVGTRGKALPYKTLLSTSRAKLHTPCFYSKSCSNGHRAASFNIKKQLEKDIHPFFIITSSCLFGLICDSYVAHQSICLQIWMHASPMQMFSKQILLRPYYFYGLSLYHSRNYKGLIGWVALNTINQS